MRNIVQQKQSPGTYFVHILAELGQDWGTVSGLAPSKIELVNNLAGSDATASMDRSNLLVEGASEAMM